MRFTDNPLEQLMKEKPLTGPDRIDPTLPPHPLCNGCPHYTSKCVFGLCAYAAIALQERADEAAFHDTTPSDPARHPSRHPRK